MTVSKTFLKTLRGSKKAVFAPAMTGNGLFFNRCFSENDMQVRQNLLTLTLGNRQPRRYYSKEATTMQPPIGISDFRKLIETRDSDGQPYLFVDKSLFIKDIIDDLAEVKLFTRPRRFGKTLNMSMLHHFFSKEVDKKPTKNLFNNLKIAQYGDRLKRHQGQYPVIFLTFKDIKNNTFKESYEDLFELIRTAYLEHEKAVMSSQDVTDRQKADYNLILDREASSSTIKLALKNLTLYLHKCYGVKPIVLIDEYDTPIQAAYVKKYYEEMIFFMKDFLSAGLKDNSHLEKAILTGILRVSKESLFSGLNNLKTYSLLDARYGEYFGFTDSEVVALLKEAELFEEMQKTREWYNGYQIGEAVIYNPWSIVNYIQEKGKLSSYWVNTSDNALIKKLIFQSNTGFKAEFELLLQDKPIEMLINEHVVFTNLETNESAVWALLLMSGYLKATVIKEEGTNVLCQLQIPNKEVKDLYRTFIAEWLSGVNNATVFNQFLNNLLIGNIADFEYQLQEIMLQTFSFRDIKGKEPEKFFHGFMLGLVACIDSSQYKIDSNKEAGLGLYDIVISPKDPNKLGIIIEIKSVSDASKLKTEAEDALTQIDVKKYEQNNLLKDVKSYLKIGVAFSGKELAVAHKRSNEKEKMDKKI